MFLNKVFFFLIFFLLWSFSSIQEIERKVCGIRTIQLQYLFCQISFTYVSSTFFSLRCIRANPKYIISTVKSWEYIASSKVSFFHTILLLLYVIKLVIFLKNYLFIYGCVGSSFLCEGFLYLWQVGTTLHRSVWASHYRGLSCCGAQAPDAQAQ